MALLTKTYHKIIKLKSKSWDEESLWCAAETCELWEKLSCPRLMFLFSFPMVALNQTLPNFIGTRRCWIFVHNDAIALINLHPLVIGSWISMLQTSVWSFRELFFFVVVFVLISNLPSTTCCWCCCCCSRLHHYGSFLFFFCSQSNLHSSTMWMSN